MSRSQRKIPDADIVAARSWVGKFVRDTRLGQLGIVHDVCEDENGVRLLSRFPGESESRPIALEPVATMEYLLPGDVKARYRPPTEADREQLARLQK